MLLSLREKCPYSELFWSVFSRIWTGYGEILRISPYSVRMRENANQNKSEYRHFLRSVSQMLNFTLKVINTLHLEEAVIQMVEEKMIFIKESLIAKRLYPYEDSTLGTICLGVTMSKNKMVCSLC